MTPTPGFHQRQKVRLAAFAAGGFALGADRTAVREELVEYRRFLVVVAGSHGVLAVLFDQGLVTAEDLLNLHRVVGDELGGGIDGGESAADDARRQAHLQVGHGGFLGSPGKLQCHQKIRRLADTADQIVLQIDDGRLARTRGDGHVIETELPRVFDGQRAAEAHAAVDLEVAPPCEREVDDLRKFLSQRTVMPYSATPPNPAITRLSRSS